MNGIAQFAQFFSTLVFFPLLVSAFGTGQYGVYVIALSVTSLALIFDFGIGASTVRFVAERLSLEDVTGFWRVVATATALLFLVGALASLVIAGIGVVAGSVFNVTPEQATLLRTLLFIGAAMQLWYWPTSVAAHVLNGLERYDLVARTSLLSTLGNVGAIGLVLLSDSGPVTLMALGAVVMVSASLINIVTLWFVGPEKGLAGLPSRPVAREIIASGTPVFMVSIAQFLNKEQVDRLVIGVAIGPTGVVMYEIAAKLSMLIGQIATLPISSVLPVASGAAARGDWDALRTLFMKGNRYITIAITPFVIVLAVVAGPFIQAWFGSGYENSISIAYLLIAAQLFFPPLLMGGPILTGAGRLGAWVPRAAFLALTNLILSVLLVGPLGPSGVALATLVASLLELPLFARFMLREMDVSFSDWFKTAWAGYAMLPIPAALVWVLVQGPLGDSLPGIGVAAALAVGAYWCGVYAILLSSEERRGLARRAKRLLAERA